MDYKRDMEAFRVWYFRRAVAEYGGMDETAEAIGVGRSTLYRHLSLATNAVLSGSVFRLFAESSKDEGVDLADA